jgi:hypothetical protein
MPFLLATTSLVSAEKISSCTLTVAGKRVISGPCEFRDLHDGDFTITKGLWFAYVLINTDNPSTAHAYWNDDDGAPVSHAHSPLGTLTRRSGSQDCWSNDQATVCAKR